MEKDERLKLIAKFGQRVEQMRCRMNDLRKALANNAGDYFPETRVSIGNGRTIWIEGASVGTRNAWQQMVELETAYVENEIEMDCDCIEALLKCVPFETRDYLKARIATMAEQERP